MVGPDLAQHRIGEGESHFRGSRGGIDAEADPVALLPQPVGARQTRHQAALLVADEDPMGGALRTLPPRQLVDLFGEQADTQHAQEVSRAVLDGLERRDLQPAFLQRQFGICQRPVEVGPDRAAVEGGRDGRAEPRVLGGIGDLAVHAPDEGCLQQSAARGPVPHVHGEVPVLQRGVASDDAPAVEHPCRRELPRRTRGPRGRETHLRQPRVRHDLGEERRLERQWVVGTHRSQPHELLDVLEDALRLVQLVLDLGADGAAGLLAQGTGAVHHRDAPAAQDHREQDAQEDGDDQSHEDERPAEGEVAPHSGWRRPHEGAS